MAFDFWRTTFGGLGAPSLCALRAQIAGRFIIEVAFGDLHCEPLWSLYWKNRLAAVFLICQ